MLSHALSNLAMIGVRPRCWCGEDMRVETFPDHSKMTEVVVVRCHERQVAQQINEYELHCTQDPEHLVITTIDRARKLLEQDCPHRAQPIDYGKVVPAFSIEAHRGPDGRLYNRAVRNVPVPTLMKGHAPPRPTVPPNFGKPIARKILR